MGRRGFGEPPFATFYLLHGLSDDYTIWLRRTSIERYAERYPLIVVMPDGYRGFYTNNDAGPAYATYLAEELVATIERTFPAKRERASRGVGGLSMGGYGAFKLALTHPERYVAAASLSGAVDIREVVKGHGNPQDQRWLAEMRTVFGDLKKVPGSQHDLFTLARKVSKAPVKPRLYQCCGTEDFLYADNIRFRDAVQKLSFDYIYEEGPGEHVWSYWDKMIQNVLAWMFQ